MSTVYKFVGGEEDTIEDEKQLPNIEQKDVAIKFALLLDEFSEKVLGKETRAYQVMKGNQELQDFRIKTNVDAITAKRNWVSDFVKSMRTTNDQNRAYEASKLEARRQGMITSLQSELDMLSSQMSVADPATRKSLVDRYNNTQAQLRNLVSSDLPTVKELNALEFVNMDYFKDGGLVRLVPKV